MNRGSPQYSEESTTDDHVSETNFQRHNPKKKLNKKK